MLTGIKSSQNDKFEFTESSILIMGRPLVFIKTPKGCWEIISHKPDSGTGYIRIRRGPKRHHLHRLSYESFMGAIPFDLCVLHKCDNKICINPEHLFCGTQTDNHKDMHSKGRAKGMFKKGSQHPNSKLTEEDVIRIRHYYRTGKYNQVQLASIYSTNDSSISMIINGKQWKHVPLGGGK